MSPREKLRHAVGFKIKLADVFGRTGFADVLKDHADSIVHLQRRNFVKMTVSFLGLESRATKGRAIKATSDNLCNAVEYFEALKSRYVGTRFEPMFEETIADQ
jgi:hypothetical protein